MKKILFFMFCTLIFGVGKSVCQESIDKDWVYDVECAGLSKDGSYLVKVNCQGKNVRDAQTKAKKAAVYTVLFKGVDGSAAGCVKQMAIVADSSTMNKNKDFFNSFFSDKVGTYLDYVTDIPGTVPFIIKKRRGYNVEIILIVKKDLLRKYLEDNKVIRGLSDIF